jgi:hypothetical protein
MNHTPLLLRRRSAWVLGALTVVAIAACQRDQTEPLAVGKNTPDLRVGLEVSSGDAAPGKRIAVAIRASAQLRTPLQGLQGAIRFDPALLSYVGQSTESPDLVMINDHDAGRGRVRALSLKVEGLGERTAVLVFQVKGPGYLNALRYEFELAGGRDLEIRKANLAGLVIVSDLSVPIAGRPTAADWSERLAPNLWAVWHGRPSFSPGQYLANLKYGDANLDGSVDLLDIIYVANVSVGNAPLIDGTNRDAVVAGNVRPVNGGTGGTPRPGEEAGSANPQGQIDLFDLLAIANEFAGFPQTVVGDVIPGRGPSNPDGTGKPRVVITTNITTNRTFSRDTVYQIGDGTLPATDVGGIIRVTNGATLTIQPGTRIEGWYGQISAGSGVGVQQGVLSIERDGRIVADGTALEPIVFTCVLPTIAGPKGEPAGTRYSGCWGGLYINGNATINATSTTSAAAGPSPVVTGRSAGGCIQEQDELNANLFGGCNDTDSSGVLRYVRSEFGGGRVTATAERNGITFDGVGSGTVVDYVESFASLDDGIESFGGTVRYKHLLLIGNEDDNFDFVLGYRGKVQFVIVQADSTDGDRCFEMDNNGIDGQPNPDASPRSDPVIYNVTCVGKAAPIRYANTNGLPFATCLTQLGSTGTPSANCVNQAFLFRQNTAGTIKNFLAYRYSVGLDFDQPSAPAVTDATGLCTQIQAGSAGTDGTGLVFRFGAIAVGPTVTTFPAGTTGALTSQPTDPDGTDPGVSGGVAADCGPYTVAAGGAYPGQAAYSGSNLEAIYAANPANNITVYAAGDANGDFLVNPLEVMWPDFRPKPGAAIGSLAAATPPNDGFFDPSANYLGALPPNNAAGIPWYSGWSRGWTTSTTK